MIEVLITFASSPSADYPLAVTVVRDGERGQETTCRSLREARIYANGICAGGREAFAKDWPINPIVDNRLIEAI